MKDVLFVFVGCTFTNPTNLQLPKSTSNYCIREALCRVEISCYREFSSEYTAPLLYSYCNLVKCNNICVYRHLCHSSFEWANRQCEVWWKKYERSSGKLCSHSTLRYQEAKKSGLQLARTTSKSGTFPTAWVLSMASMLLCKLPKIQARLFSTTREHTLWFSLLCVTHITAL